MEGAYVYNPFVCHAYSYYVTQSSVDMVLLNSLPSPPPSHRLVFTVVADPEEQEGDCVEVGTAELDLNKVGLTSCAVL